MHADYLLISHKEYLKDLKEHYSKKSIKKAPTEVKAGGDKWTRTTDSRIFSPMLYQLSYITVF